MMDLSLTTATSVDNPVEGDLHFEHAELAVVEDSDAIAQEVRVVLRWWRGEWFLDTSLGVPYVEELLGKGVSEAVVRSVLTRAVEAVPGVARVVSIAIASDRQTRYTTVDLDILTDDGATLELVGIPLGVS